MFIVVWELELIFEVVEELIVFRLLIFWKFYFDFVDKCVEVCEVLVFYVIV